MILLIDNYDSFTYNLYQYLSEYYVEIMVVRNDKLSIPDIEKIAPEGIVISPGPGRPENAGITIEAIKHFYDKIPILGICLGHQAIGAAFGARILGAAAIKHGKTSLITHKGTDLFEYLPQPLEVMRYHSLVVDRETVPEEFDILATAMDDGEIMAMKHKGLPLYGLQFHPESIGTSTGKKLLKHFIEQVKGEKFDEDFSAKIS
ncbi:aminodeoxychorismate/anthranilate synthase component II [Peribacillus saganii]|uniref:Aminodeoxychorismate/anthranilate synthase component II n=1 Tax=Peribacillus saganii TaxID=2303992 RepID=A0A372LT92_9BACI|nr:aminodeoxychorismate/anthranilate synthase component II [Peribacillus saganii]RFU71117.1 aminodeoxychorismate/anthranilate synthase component II [Peribacillus saganii]